MLLPFKNKNYFTYKKLEPFLGMFDHSSLNQMQTCHQTYTCHQTCTFYHIFHSCFFVYFSIKILSIQKIYVVHQGLFITYLYVYVYDNISKDNDSKFPKSPNPHLSAGLGMAWNLYGLSRTKGGGSTKQLFCQNHLVYSSNGHQKKHDILKLTQCSR